VAAVKNSKNATANVFAAVPKSLAMGARIALTGAQNAGACVKVACPIHCQLPL